MLFAATVGALVGLLAVDGGAAPDSAAEHAAACDPLAVRAGGHIDLRALERFAARQCNLDVLDAKGETLLSWALRNDEKALLWLVEHGADHKNFKVGNQTLLHIIAEADSADSLKIVGALIRHGADVNATAGGIGTPLMVAVKDIHCRQTKQCRCSSGEDEPDDCWQGNPKMVRALLAHGADPNRADGFGMPPLFMAIERNHLDDVQALLAAHARPGGLDENQETLWQLMNHPDLRIVRALLAAGADVNERNGYGDPPLYLLAQHWVRGARAPLAAAAKLLLARGADPRAINEHGETPLHEAASVGFTAMARVLIAARAPVDAADKKGQTPLHLAAWQGRADVAALLLSHGADASRKDASGLTPLHWLARGRTAESSKEDFQRTLRLLVAHGARLDERDREGRAPLWHARDIEVRGVLLAHGAAKKEVGARGVSLLHLAVFRDDGDLIWRQVGGSAGANPNVMDADGRTPLHWAAFLGRTRAADRLIRMSETDLDAADGKGRTPLDWAIASCATPIAAQLVRKGARASATDWKRRLDACPARPEPPPIDERLHRGISLGDLDLVNRLLDGGLPVDGRDARGRSPLHVASATRSGLNRINLLLERGARVDAVDREGQTPLHLAASGTDVDGARVLLKAGANVNAADDHGRTPLHLAEARDSSSFDLYRLLIDAGAKLDARDVMGRTPLQAVCDTDNEWAVKAAALFVCRGAEAEVRDAFGWSAAEIARMHGWRDTTIPRCPTGDRAPARTTGGLMP